MRQVVLDPNDVDKGYSLILHIGSVVYTGEKGRYIVPEESIEALKKSEIKFEIKPIAKVKSGK